jgi:hypothetical protein
VSDAKAAESTTVDYTTMAEGAIVSRAGSIRRCPVCGRLGERRPNAAKTKPWMFVHSSRITHRARRTDVEIVEKCTSPSGGDDVPKPKPQQMGWE